MAEIETSPSISRQEDEVPGPSELIGERPGSRLPWKPPTRIELDFRESDTKVEDPLEDDTVIPKVGPSTP